MDSSVRILTRLSDDLHGSYEKSTTSECPDVISGPFGTRTRGYDTPLRSTYHSEVERLRVVAKIGQREPMARKFSDKRYFRSLSMISMTNSNEYRVISATEEARQKARVTKAKLDMTWSEFIDHAADALDPDTEN